MPCLLVTISGLFPLPTTYVHRRRMGTKVLWDVQKLRSLLNSWLEWMVHDGRDLQAPDLPLISISVDRLITMRVNRILRQYTPRHVCCKCIVSDSTGAFQESSFSVHLSQNYSCQVCSRWIQYSQSTPTAVLVCVRSSE